MLNTPNRNEILKEGPPLNAKYNILGRGAYGTVFKAIFRAQPVAVKIVRNINKANAQALHNESNILGWKHRNIIRTFKIESTPSFGIVIMERFMGQSLQTILDTMALPLEHQIFISLDILSALSYCHKRQLLHLDVKPQNVLVSFGAATTPAATATATAAATFLTTATSKLHAERLISRNCARQYICKLCDFGASMKLSNEAERPQTATVTAKGTARGTVRYMAPEALREQPLTAAADIYSLGITMWQLQQRRLPYHWLECNEVVAYQVVKHNLRPDAIPAPSAVTQCSRASTNARCGSSSPAATAHMCSCTYQNTTAAAAELEASEITSRSLEHISHMLNCSKAPTEQLHFSDCSIESAQQLGERRPFQELSTKMNVLRDLRAEWEATSLPAAQPTLTLTPSKQRLLKRSEGGSSEQQKLLTLFASVLRVQNRSKECSYETLYRSCWQNAALLRPSAYELRRRLVQLLCGRGG